MTPIWAPLPLLMRAGALAAAISVAGGLAMAWFILNRTFAGRRYVAAIAPALVALPAPLLCYCYLAASRRMPLSEAGLVVAGALAGLPLMAWAARPALTALDAAYAKAGRSVGASDSRMFLRVELPLAWRPLAMAGLVVCARIAAEIAAAYWLLDKQL